MSLYQPAYIVSQGSQAGGGGPARSGYKRKASSTSSSAKGKSKKGVVSSDIRSLKKTPKQIIAKVVREIAEKKSTNNEPIGYLFSLSNTACSAAVDLVFQALDGITQGTANGQRIGNEIYVHEMELRMSFSFFPAAVANAPVLVQMWIATLKDDPAKLPTVTDLGRIYDDGGGVSGPDGTMLATLRNMNTDYWNFKCYKAFKLGPSGGSMPNNECPINVLLKVPNICKGKVRYNDATVTCNKHAFLFMTYTTLDNTPVFTRLVDCQYYVAVKYSDV